MSTPAPEKNLDTLRRFAAARPGQKLPGEREMAEQFGISRPRLRTLLAVLEAEGRLERRQGSGTYAIAGKASEAEATPHAVLVLIDENIKLGDDPFFSYLVECLQAAVQAEGARCVVQRLAPGHAFPVHREDGVITVGLEAGTHLLRSAAPHPRPGVALLLPGTPPAHGRVSLIQCDNEAAGAEAARALFDPNVRQVWYFGYHPVPASAERLAGVLCAAAAANVTVTVRNDVGLNFGGGRQAARDLPRPAAGEHLGIIAANDWLAVGLHTGLTAQGIPPTAFKIVSFDGLEVAADPAMGIRSLAAPIEAIAEDAVSELRRLAGRSVRPGRLLRYGFTWRSG